MTLRRYLISLFGAFTVLPGVVPNVILNSLENATTPERLNTPIYPQASLETLRMIVMIIRHGSRTPLSTYPTDPYPPNDSKFWPDGPNGQLTTRGKQELYKTGLLLRDRYADFLSPLYNYNETTAWANPINRDYMSAGCLLAGLYPPTGYELWNSSILWQPIPIWPSFDIINLYLDPKLCPAFSVQLDKVVQNLELMKSSEFHDAFEIITKYSGKNVTNIYNAFWFYDSFQMDYENGYTLPTWAHSIYPEPITTLASLRLHAFTSGSPEILRLCSGYSMNAIADALNSKINGSKPNKKIDINAAHEITLSCILNALGFTKIFYPSTGSYLVFELHEFPSQNYTVEMLYYENSTAITPIKLEVPNCPNPCSLTAFTQMVRSGFPTNWREQCSLF